MKKWMAALICTALAITTICTDNPRSTSAASKTTLAALDLSYSNLYDTDTETKYINSKNPKSIVSGGKLSLDLADKYGSKDKGYKFTRGNGLLFASLNGNGKRKLEWSGDADKFQDGSSNVYAPVMTAGKKNPWNPKNLPYFEIQFSTAGYEDISFSAYIGATKKAPKNYRLSYRTGNSGTYTALPDAAAHLTLTKNKFFTRIGAKLPKTADKQTQVTVRIYAVSADTVGGGTLSDNPTGGKIGINHISIQGSAAKKEGTGKKDPGTNSNKNIRAAISKASLKKKKVTIRIKKAAGAAGYQVKAGSNKKITKNTKTVRSRKTKIVIKKWKSKKCYLKVRAYQLGANNKKIYGPWSSVKKAK